MPITPQRIVVLLQHSGLGLVDHGASGFEIENGMPKEQNVGSQLKDDEGRWWFICGNVLMDDVMNGIGNARATNSQVNDVDGIHSYPGTLKNRMISFMLIL